MSIPLVLREDAAETAFHGGKSFEAIGEDLQHLDRAAHVINADVLDAWFDPSPRVLRNIRRFLPFLTRTSPPVYAAGLVRTIAHTRNLQEDCILAGEGSSDLIFTCFPQLVRRSDKVMILDPMYGEYRHIVEAVIGAEVIYFDLHKEEDFRIDTPNLIARALATRPNLIVLVNPNSPTGEHWPRRELLRFLDAIPDFITVVVDETYVEYVGSTQSVEDEACKRSNLIVLKSMSKAYALSGLRVGYLVGAASTVRLLAKWMPPWAISLPAQVAAIEALNDKPYYERRYRQTHALREELVRGLHGGAHVKIYPSTANFLLIEMQSSAQRKLEHMRRSNVFVRNCDSMGLRFGDRFLRIAVKRRDENTRIVEAFCR
jgi:histidinol-phosphate aminotransferase